MDLYDASVVKVLTLGGREKYEGLDGRVVRLNRYKPPRGKWTIYIYAASGLESENNSMNLFTGHLRRITVQSTYP